MNTETSDVFISSENGIAKSKNRDRIHIMPNMSAMSATSGNLDTETKLSGQILNR